MKKIMSLASILQIATYSILARADGGGGGGEEGSCLLPFIFFAVLALVFVIAGVFLGRDAKEKQVPPKG